MRIILVLLSFVMVGCATMEPTRSLHVEPEFQTYFDLFQYEAHRRGIPMAIDNLRIIFTNEFNGTDTLAECETNGDLTPIIRVSREFWEEYEEETTREQVLNHEFGHCILKLDHIDTWIVWLGENIPTSIMSTYLFDDYYYIKYRDYYLDELFGTI